MRLKPVLAIVSLLSLGGALPAQAQTPAGCTIKELRKLFGSDAPKPVLARFKELSPGAKKGVVAILGHPNPALGGDVVEDILELFKPPARAENPFGSDEGIFEAVGELTEQVGVDLLMPKGMEKTILELANRGAGDEDGVLFFQGAVFDLFTARDVRSKGVAGLEFQRKLPVGATGEERIADLIEPCASCPGDVGFIQHENKNWTTRLREDGPDGRLLKLSDQFQRDIVLHVSSGLETWRLNLRAVVQDQKDLIRDQLLLEFDSDLVRVALAPAARSRARTRFLELWEAGLIVQFY